MGRHFYKVFFLILITSAVYGQSRVDSLIQEVSDIAKLEPRIDAYNEICDLLWHDNPALAMSYADTVYQLSKNVNYEKGRVLALTNKGSALYTVGKYKEAAKLYKKAMAKGDSANVASPAELYYLNLLKKQGDYSSLLSYFKKLKSRDSVRAKHLKPSYLILLTEAYIEMGNVIESEKLIRTLSSQEAFRQDSIFRAKANLVIARFYRFSGQYDSASYLIQEAMDIYYLKNDRTGHARAVMDLGGLKLVEGEMKAARKWLDSGLVLCENNKYAYAIAEAKRNLGELYSALSENDRATKFYFDALDIFEGQRNINEMAKVYNSLAWIYQSQGAYETAYDFIVKAIALSEEIGNKSLSTSAYNTYGTFLNLTDSLEKAVEAYQHAYQISLEAGDKKKIAAAMYNIAFVNEQLNRYDKVLKMYLDAYEIEKEIGNKLGMAISEYTLGSFYTKMNKYDKAEKYLEMAQTRISKLGSKGDLLFCYLYFGELYDKKGDYKKANTYYKLYIHLKEELTDEEVRAQMAELDVKYDLKNKDREIAFLNLENKSRQQELSIKEQVIENQRLFIIFTVLGSLLLIALLFLSYRLLRLKNKSNQKLHSLNEEIQEKNEEITAQAEELQEANQQVLSMNQILEEQVDKRTQELKQAYAELDTFFYRSSHDFRRPLTTFLGLAEVARSTLKNEYSLDLFNKVETTALQLDKMVYKLKAMSLIGSDALEKRAIDFDELIGNICDNRLKSNNKSAKIEKEIDLKKPFISYYELLEIIFENIIENSLQYNFGKPQLNIIVTGNEKHVCIEIGDNGEGIEDVFQGRVFDMYYRASEHSAGNGLGLYLVQKAVNKLDGSIELISEVGKGTTIKIFLPLSS